MDGEKRIEGPSCHMVKRIILSAILALVSCFLFFADIFMSWVSDLLFVVVFFAVFFVLGFLVQKRFQINSKKRYLRFFMLAPVFLILAFAGTFVFCKLDYLVWDKKDHSEERQVLDSGRDNMFSGKKVMVFVPHEDDDVLLMGGVLEQYVKHNSDVYVVFAENGDSGVSKSSYKIGKELGQARAKEAVRTLTSYGIPEKNIIFLGFGSTIFKDKPHLYNYKDDPDKVVRTVSGYEHTYAGADHPAYNEGEEITKNNLNKDYESLLKEYKPDVIFCIDYDLHPGHRSVSLTFESVLGKVLKEQSSYRPVVYKGFAYENALYTIPDYYDNVNQASTVNPYDTDYMQETNTYLWNDRVRFPVSVNTLTHYYLSSDTSKKLSFYETQRGDWYEHLKAIINSDKVFWERNTDSILYNAEITSSSGNSQVLNDFMLFDCDNITVGNTDFSKISGIWIPSSEDNDRKIRVVLNAPSDIESICLYDNPCLEDNIENAKIIFDDGSEIETGKLAPGGSATKISINKNGVKSFEIVLTAVAGNRAGLSEIEAYGPDAKGGAGFIKLMDDTGDFVYDYYMNGTDEIKLRLYRYNYDTPLSSSYKIETDNKNVSAAISDDSLVVRCPQGQSCIIKLTSPDGLASDTIRVSNISNARSFMKGVRLTENFRTLAVFTGLKILLLVLILLVLMLVVPDERKKGGHK